jgi:hypothetical protein
MSISDFLSRAFWVEDEDIRAAVKRVPEAGAKAMQQARLSAIALERDREQMRVDLMRQRRELKEDLEMVECALDELDALRILETAT